MTDLLNELRQQHKTILKMIEDQGDIYAILDFVEDVHHPLEEDALFPAVSEHPKLREGGPMCTYFRGLLLDLNPHEPVQRRLKELYAAGLPQPEPYRTFSWLRSDNPLSIPMDEHHIGHAVASALRWLRGKENTPLHTQYFVPLCESYISLLKTHIDKEDNCLFIMCAKLLG